VSASGGILTHESGLVLDLSRRELRARGVSVPIGGRAFEILAILAQSGEELVGKDELMQRVWPGAVVEENTLQAHIAAIRKALGADRDSLKTVSGRGYRLVGNWTPGAATGRAQPPSPAPNSVAGQVSAQPPSSEPSPAARQGSRTNLSVSPIDLLGRAFATRHVEEVLVAHRVVTLTGPGGIGKTALALQVAQSVFTSTQVDTYLVDLAPLSDPHLVPSTIAGILDVRLGSGESDAAAVARAIGARQLLLVIDNCEHLIDAAANMMETMIQMCRGVSVLATSRENLRIVGEYVYRVGPLSVPTEQDLEPDVILAQSAVQLFIARVKAAQAAFSPDPANLLQVAAVCRRLDGIPLAIEFAAARAATLGVAQVAARLDDRFGLLTAGRRTALPRQQTLRATLDWSYELLPEWERRLLRRSAIFPAGFTLEAASAVDPERQVTSVLEGIANLVAKSLLSLDGAPSGGRWRLLETIRAYALEKLAEKGEADDVARLSAGYFRDLFRSNRLGSPGQSGPRDRTSDRRELDNVRASIDWALSPNGDQRIGLELTAESAPLWFQLSLMEEYCQRVETALKRLQTAIKPDDELEMHLQVTLGHAVWYTDSFGDLEAMKRAFMRAAELAERAGNTEIRLKALWGTWAAGRGKGDNQSALGAATRYEMIADGASDKSSIILGARMLALTHHDLGNLKTARHHVDTVLSQAPHPAPDSGNDLQVDARVAMLTLLARVQWLQGFPDQADATVREAIDAALRMHNWFSICYVLFFAGGPVSFWIGDLAEAEIRLEMLRDRTGGNSEFPGFSLFTRLYATIVRLRKGSQSDALTAAYIEPRVHYPTVAALGKMILHSSIAAPFPDDIPCDAPWSLAEVLRVDAELLLWRGEPGAVSAAETKLQRSLELARQQAALSWELRTALSLARLRIRQDRLGDAQELLAPVFGKFTEGFGTSDLRSARAILESPQ
jgi:predicted ATPase/DNA-binding winged helix-turn-helix (wHTH) protein